MNIQVIPGKAPDGGPAVLYRFTAGDPVGGGVDVTVALTEAAARQVANATLQLCSGLILAGNGAPHE